VSAKRSTMHDREDGITPFLFATGIENSYPVIRIGSGERQGQLERRDGMELSGHYQRWREDFGLVKEMGIDVLRYGPPLYRTHVGPGKYDWTFADETFGALQQMRINPITDLCHFGVPDWISDFQNSDWPEQFAAYAGAFAERFPWVQMYTPVNEIYIAATFSAQLGWWNERLSSDRAFVTALKHLVRANLLAEEAILKVRPDALFVQSESSEYFHRAGPDTQQRADFFNEKRFLSLDLTYGHDVSATLYEYLMDNGLTREEYHWFGDHGHAIRHHCIMGNDYYITNEHKVTDTKGGIIPSGEIFGYYVITHQYFERYRLPVMHTETNRKDAEEAPNWLWKEWSNIVRLRQDGVPIVGFTWYSLIDQTDWDTALREDNHRINPCGLFDMDRKIRPVGREYKELIRLWRDRMPMESLSRQIRFPTEPDQHPSARKSHGGEKEIKRARSHKRASATHRAAKSHSRY
jgi:beta-glucosidase/6-phospho-beta-glucosidase/beta-galactosidase